MFNQNQEKQKKPIFKNTRSKFYKKSSDYENDDNNSSSKNHKDNNIKQQLTGEYWKKKGNEEVKKSNYALAIEYYSKAIEINEGESLYYSNRAKCFKMLNNFPKALKDAENACQLNDQNIKAHYICGCILAEMGKSEENKLKKAENRLKKALRLCTTLFKTQFQEQVSIRLFRLRKLIWYVDNQKEIEVILCQRNINKKCLQNKLITEEDFKKCEQVLGDRSIKLSAKNREVPDYLCCKITLMLMEEPVSTEQGFTYEKDSLIEHYKTNGFIEPLTRKACSGKYVPNHALKQAIQSFLHENPWGFEHENQEDYLKIAF